MRLKYLPIEYISEIADISTAFEKDNSDLKKRYIIKNIDTISSIMSTIPGFKGSFGTGYPFYALGKDFKGNLPVIQEQINYNNALKAEVIKYTKPVWYCAECLEKFGPKMKDLKVICKSCPGMADGLKPRKVINRLPDVDMWMVCDDELVEDAKLELKNKFFAAGMYSSDIDPLRTMEEIKDIVTDLQHGNMPSKFLPLDIHIVGYSEFKELVEQVPGEIASKIDKKSKEFTDAPYVPILPFSLRKDWQHDDMAYNFVLDFMYSLTPQTMCDELKESIDRSRMTVAKMLTEAQRVELFNQVAGDSTKRRFESKVLQKCYKERVQGWKTL